MHILAKETCFLKAYDVNKPSVKEQASASINFCVINWKRNASFSTKTTVYFLVHLLYIKEEEPKYSLAYLFLSN